MNNYQNFECLNTLSGHTEGILFLAISPDKQTGVSGSWDKIRLWNLNTGQEIRTLINVIRILSVQAIAISTDGQTLVCSNGEGIIKVWNLKSGQQIQCFKGHSAPITSVALSRNGQTLASSSEDNTIKIWNLTKEREIGLLVKSEFISGRIALSSDGQTLAYAKGSIIQVWNQVWDWRSREEITLEGHEWEVESLVISADGQILVSGSWDKTIKVWNPITGEEIQTQEGHSDCVSSLAISADGRILVSGSYDKTIKIWNLTTGKEIYTLDPTIGKEISTLEEDLDRISAVAISADGQTIVSGSWNKTIKV